jgi:hypothetical protein
MRTASETVSPSPARTAAARSFTAGSMRVCTNALARIAKILGSNVIQLHDKSRSIPISPRIVESLQINCNWFADNYEQLAHNGFGLPERVSIRQLDEHLPPTVFASR